MDTALLKPHLVDLGGGRRLNFHCVGKGSPTVVFEQGGEGLISNWSQVQPSITARTRTCFYDRAGFGYSDPPNEPVTAISVTDDLRQLLRRGHTIGPVVLVGHSIGGFYATVYANRFPEDVAGLVLVDPGFAGQGDGLRTDRENANNRRGEGYLVRCGALARAGKLAADNLADNRCFPLPDGSTPDEAAYILHAVTGPHWYEAEHSQSVNYFSGDDEPSVSHRQEMATRRAFGGMPLIVLSAEVFPRAPWRSDAEHLASQENWYAGHKALAARSRRGEWRLVPGSDHFIQKTKPEAVVAAIAEVLAATRAVSTDRRR